MKINKKKFLYLLFLSLLLSLGERGSTVAASLTERPEESITYWKLFEISPNEDPDVKTAHEVFERLLAAWEKTRIAPELHIVHSDEGPWAASLDDGHILLSREAVDKCLDMEKEGGLDRLAFVLAHELSHQRADHLWHRRYFRLAVKQPPRVQGRMLSEMPVDKLEIEALEAKEIQADRGGLLLISLTGFDPYRVAGSNSRFFEAWVESIWGEPCGVQAESKACIQARTRAAGIQAYLRQMAGQTLLFKLGIQAYVIGRYRTARRFFTAFGREFPGREVHNNIGLTYTGEAIALRRKLLAMGEDLGPGFLFRYLLDEEPGVPKESTRRGTTRGGTLESGSLRIHKELETKLTEAGLAFERAIKLDPSYREAYWNLTSTYLLLNNAPAAYGVMAGNYLKRFGEDAMALMLLGITAYLDGQREKAGVLLRRAVENGKDDLAPFTRANLAAYLNAEGDMAGWKSQWKKLAGMGRRQGDEILFRLALKQLGKKIVTPVSVKNGVIEEIQGYILGQRVLSIQKKTKHFAEEIWVEGERIQVYEINDGARMALDSGSIIIALWQEDGKGTTVKGIKIGDNFSKADRVYKSLWKKAATSRGEYRVYDDYGIAFHIINSKIAGWFLF